MSYLIDTNVLCELVKPSPNEKVLQWFDQIENDHLFVSVITFGEIRNGVDQLPASTKKKKLQLWLENELPAWFEERVLSVDSGVADCWGRLGAQMKRPLPVVDRLLAATAIHHDFVLVTRNVKDFDIAHLRLVNPFQ